MKSHGLALLAMWVLVSPPPLLDAKGRPGTLVDADRPLAEWQRLQSFKTAGECRTHLKDWQIEGHEEAEHAAKPLATRMLLELNRRQASRCLIEGPPHGSR
jgi:hypothetical protein